MATLVEAVTSIVEKNGKTRAKLIAGNVRGSSAYYPSEILERDASKFYKGLHMYVNHMSESEKFERPEGDINNLVGVLESDAVFEEDGLYADIHIFEHKKAWVKEIAPYIGLSIRANGAVQESADGTPVLTAIEEVLSVDLVSRAGAGGKFISLAESAKPGVLTEAQAEIPKKDEESTLDKELKEALDAQVADVKAMTESNKTLAEAVSALVESLKPEPKKEATATEVAEALVEAKLTKSSRARVMAAVDGGAELAEAIKAEQDLQKEILEEAEKSADLEGNLQESKKSEELFNGFIS